ncbi:PRD domain-containing protein [Streptococcus chenjunshii]|uniref:PRD domain-containing protein n=1 Tax=Streptococcus chenjunshii TaxID=2173853 RepID=A0A372KQ66_9STRE|nr:PRD domain-containing protein [Streptococcus chenjunshii]AXQ77837.1 PRD domain-containing protein [Streptococcus chenjunshii]RFU51348.1 PRD domain-containing protein [Streptococcus chenjunshii]RFU53778.1 PRD domain-containing protein [Streptococcus chenjunshii]
MALVNRWYQILNALIAQPQLSIDEMLELLAVSEKTLQTSISQLNELLDEDVQIRQEGNQLYIDVFDYARLEEILSGSLRKESDFNSSGKRVSYIIKRLLQSSEPLLIDDLAEEIAVSRTTINKDLKQVKHLASDYQISVKGKPNRGIEINGDELSLRLFYCQNVYAYFDTAALQQETQTFLQELSRDYHLPRKMQDLLSKVVAITVARIKRQKQIDHAIAYYCNGLKNAEIIEKLVYHLEVVYHITLSQFEQDFLSFPLNTQFIAGLSYENTDHPMLEPFYRTVIRKVRTALNVDFDEEKLFHDMYGHLTFLINRLIFHVQITDIFHGEVKNKYPLAFEMARAAGDELRHYFGYPLAAAEISYLALYFEMAVREHEDEQLNRRRRIAVVCTTGRGTAAMIHRQLTRVLGSDIDIVQYSEETFNPQADDDYFAVFTTIPLKYPQLQSPIIHITNLFDDQWLQAEWQKVNVFHQKNLESVTLKFIRLSEGSSYQDYLRQMTAVLADQDLVDSDFGWRVLEREIKQPTVFGGGIAFPHTVNRLKQKKTIMMLGLVEAGDEPEFIFLVAIPESVESEMETELLTLYDDIFRTANDEQLKNALRQVQTEADLLALSKNKGVF